MSEKVIRIRIDLDGETKLMFGEIKERYNLSTNTEVIRLIIKLAYDSQFTKVQELGPGKYIFKDGVPIKVEKRSKKEKEEK